MIVYLLLRSFFILELFFFSLLEFEDKFDDYISMRVCPSLDNDLGVKCSSSISESTKSQDTISQLKTIDYDAVYLTTNKSSSL